MYKSFSYWPQKEETIGYLFHLIHVVQLLLDGGGHEGGEPPGGEPGPHARVHRVEVLQVLLVMVGELGVDLLHPPVRDHVLRGGPEHRISCFKCIN